MTDTPAPVLMVLGTASSVGKSLLVTALCRAFHQQGIHVAPFKAQNMSNNADVTPDGLEIGRAQAEQAAAAGLLPSVEMNPVLLKPQGDRTSQVILNGLPAGVMHSVDFLDRKRDLWPDVERALDTLRGQYELIVAEGAGSPAEPNLQATDIVNLRVARHTRATTVIVGDIDRGGVFAHLVGTLELIPPEDRPLVRGFIINRFRGDPSLLTPAIQDLERRTSIPVLGVVPWIDDVRLADEDAVALERPSRPWRPEHLERGAPTDSTAVVDVAVIRFPRIANFDDFDPLRDEPDVSLRYVDSVSALGKPTLIVLPGTRATIADLDWLRSSGLDSAIREHAAEGGHVLGICGGLQMLGTRLLDPDGVEAVAGTAVPGLGLLALETRFVAEKTTRRVEGTVVATGGAWASATGIAVSGYEIHSGEGVTEAAPFIELSGLRDGAISSDGLVAGTYLHGLLHNDALRTRLLESLGRPPSAAAQSASALRDREFDRLAAVVRANLDFQQLETMLWPPG
ncbi:MAG: cobyric acid synthase [Dehalococcoidia bacterium]|jgi:adenosylcobyric acid synthase|nr:cobyric acid synthase [Dehalococcoidia bacterium]